MLRSVQGYHSVRIVVELVRDHEPITGVVCGEGNIGHRFFGWLELAAVLEEARKSQIANTDPRSGSTHRTDGIGW